MIYHLAAIVSAQAEAEFDLGLEINLMGSLNVFQAARALGTSPVVVFTSSVAVYGGDVPEMLEDWTALNPQTSYGAEKAAAELILTDMSRKGFLDGRGLRLPTITVRPGKPNKASTGFMSSIFREPLQGQPSNCPVDRDYPVWHCSPRTVVQQPRPRRRGRGGGARRNRCFALPGRTDTIGEMVDAMTRVAGPEPASRITWDKDEWIEGIVRQFRAYLNPQKALALGSPPTPASRTTSATSSRTTSGVPERGHERARGPPPPGLAGRPPAVRAAPPCEPGENAAPGRG